MNILDALRCAWNLGFAAAALAKPSASQKAAMLEADMRRVAAELEARRAQPANTVDGRVFVPRELLEAIVAGSGYGMHGEKGWILLTNFWKAVHELEALLTAAPQPPTEKL